ncbi:M61 family metallopeptidase [Rhodoferax antarcticus]|uniref:M61 glycyl aminopeptidase family protein n=1 Tax=Rhodoferax antarcticus ANT.BR TaxID=1111071 RepID=A0A1Q8YKX9_9BURK|nr:M61 family metallopeptidase [Rhodoferax antarcticus]APW47435.1 peptidase M61 [Rhodoferax antarcticus]OLP08560.1 M61 glycyl aminopeptidase family protein [Rhodoferax antarcticus ANT.BR]
MPRTARPRTAPPCPLDYQVSVADLHAHLFAVTLTVARPQASQIVSLPVWIAGSYMVREFSKHLQSLQAQQGKQALAITQLDKCTWQVDCQTSKPLTLSYQVYAFDNSVRTAWLDTQRGFFNGTSLCLKVHGQEDQPHRLTLARSGWPKDWQAATALRPDQADKNGFGSYLAADYDELVDSPVEMGAFWSANFTARGVPHRFVVAGASASFDSARLLADTQAICEAEIDFWHGKAAKRQAKGKGETAQSRPPHDRYVFMLNAVDNSYGGLEHRHSTALICKRADLPRLGQAKALTAMHGYTSLLGLISHEYFHTWNVKRLRPAEFARYDYASENYTELLWFFEGFTSYYDDLLLLRAGLIDDTTYLALLGKALNAVLQTPGRQVQSVAQASFDAWVKYYRQDENTLNATISYYTLGSLVALCLDLSLRQGGKTSLDAVMRALWQRCAGGPMTEADLLAVLQALSGESFADRLAAWVHSTTEMPVKELLAQQGVTLKEEAAPLADQLGLKVAELAGIRIRAVLRGSAAEQAGLAAGDEWLGMEVGAGKAAQGWRLTKLDDLPLYLGSAKTFRALLARDQRLVSLSLNLPDSVRVIKLLKSSKADPALTWPALTVY